MSPTADLREARVAAGLTQAKLAKRAGTSQSRLSSYENNRITPNRSTRNRLLRATQRLPSEAIRENREEILRSAQGNGLSDVRVFGSVARRSDTIHSDIDLLVTAQEGTSLMELAGFAAQVEDLTGFDVDVVSDGNISKDSEILREARSL